jgi:hypothetical protein
MIMKTSIKTIALASAIIGSLLLQAGPVMARDYWHWAAKEHRWERRANIGTERSDLEEAKRQLQYDRHHRASHRKIAEDEARIRDIERDLRALRR